MSEPVAQYPHDENFWNEHMSSYAVSGDIPTSSTLSSVMWATPSEFAAADSVLFEKYFGEGFMQHFKDSLYTLMKAVDFQKMYQGLTLVDNFKEQFLDSTINDNTGTYDYHFPKVGDEYPVPDEIKTLWSEIPFADLIFNASLGNYAVDYARSYKLNAYLRALDENENAGITTVFEIELN